MDIHTVSHGSAPTRLPQNVGPHGVNPPDWIDIIRINDRPVRSGTTGVDSRSKAVAASVMPAAQAPGPEWMGAGWERKGMLPGGTGGHTREIEHQKRVRDQEVFRNRQALEDAIGTLQELGQQCLASMNGEKGEGPWARGRDLPRGELHVTPLTPANPDHVACGRCDGRRQRSHNNVRPGDAKTPCPTCIAAHGGNAGRSPLGYCPSCRVGGHNCSVRHIRSQRHPGAQPAPELTTSLLHFLELPARRSPLDILRPPSSNATGSATFKEAGIYSGIAPDRVGCMRHYQI